jgi:hypothetical protein
VAGFDTLADCAGECAAVGVRITHWGGAKVRRLVKIAAPFGGNLFAVHNNTLRNGLRGLLERVLKYREADGQLSDLPRPRPVALGAMDAFFAAYSGTVRCATPLSDPEFLQGYTGRRRTIYEQAVESLRSSPFVPRDAEVGPAFVKAEKINFGAKPDPSPRIIQPRNPRYNVEVGRYLRRIEHDVYQNIASLYGGPTVMKGYTPYGVASNLREMWDEFADPVAIGLDATRFDMHVRRELLEFEHSVYALHFYRGHRKRLRRLLKLQLRNVGQLRCSDGVAKYVVDGGRMSGDMNTALGNCLIMCAIIYTYGVAGLGLRLRLANNGDDCVVVMNRCDLARFCQHLERCFWWYGIRLKVEEPVYRFEQIEFCQTRPVKTTNGWLMCRDPHVALAKDLVATNPEYCCGNGFRKWAGAVGQCGLAIAGGLPIFDSFYSKLASIGIESRVATDTAMDSGFLRMARGMRRGHMRVEDEVRVSFFLAFGINPSQQMAIEEAIDQWEIHVPETPGLVYPALSRLNCVLW